jgi:drug/metabolite transporter (DMT)-like permease
MKSLIWIGAVVVLIGVVLLAGYVIGRFDVPPAIAVNGTRSVAPAIWFVILGSLSLAIGSALIGIGVGRWQQPRHTHTLPLGQTRHGSEV